MAILDLLHEAVRSGEKLGASFVEARYDDLTLRTMLRENREFRDGTTIRRRGLGVAVYFRGAVGYSYTATLEPEAAREAAEKALSIARGSSHILEIGQDPGKQPRRSRRDVKVPMGKAPTEVSLEEKRDMVQEASEAAYEHGEAISSVVSRYGEMVGTKAFVNSEGTEVSWQPSVVDLRVSVTSKDASGNLVDAYQTHGGSVGMETFREGHDPRHLGEEAALWAKEKLRARAAPAGEFRALCENRLVGVLAHESFGHMTEADFVITGASPLADRVGKRLGSDLVSIIDEGVVDNKRYQPFWLPFDDQGMETTRTVLLDHGVLRGYLHSRQTACKLEGQPTGNARAINFYFPPIPRMKNTYFMPGDMTEEEALEALGTGIYAMHTAGGQVNLDGTFLFKAIRGFWVEGGVRKYPLKDVILTGNMLEFLQRVEGVTKDLEIHSGYFGGCGKERQFPLPVGTGGPKLVISKVRFGGEAG